MREDVLRAKVIELTRRLETELPDVEVDGHRLHELSERLRHVLENAGNALHEEGHG